MANKSAKKKSSNTGSAAKKSPSKTSALAKAEAKAEKIVNSSSDSGKNGKKQNGVAQYFKELRSEFKKVVWPSRKTVVNNTAVVLVAMIISGLVIWGLDSCFAALLNMMVK